MLSLTKSIRKYAFSPFELIREIWCYEYQEFRFILEQADELHYFHVSANAQRFFCRSMTLLIAGLILIISGLAIHSSISVWRYHDLEASKREADKKREEALSAIAALSEKKINYRDEMRQGKLINIAHEYRDRLNKMQILINYSSQELKLATNALEEGLKASGLGSGIIHRIKTKTSRVNGSIGGSSEEVQLDDSSNQLLINYRNNLAQLEQLKRVYEYFPKKNPTEHAITTSKYGARIHPITRKLTIHEGLDFMPTIDQNAKAVIAGVVEKVQHSNSGYGNMVVLLHPNNIRTTYAHLETIQVRTGQKVLANQVLGKIGNTGSSTGKHLHYEVSIDDTKINPSIITAIAKNVQ